MRLPRHGRFYHLMDTQLYLPKLSQDTKVAIFSHPVNNLISSNFASSIRQIDFKFFGKFEVLPSISSIFTVDSKLCLEGKSYIKVGDLRCGRRPLRETNCAVMCIHQGLMSKGQIFSIADVAKTIATQLYCNEAGETSLSIFDALGLRRAYCIEEVFTTLLQNRIVTVRVHALSEDCKINQRLFLNITGISADKFCVDDPRSGRKFKLFSRICRSFEAAWIW